MGRGQNGRVIVGALNRLFGRVGLCGQHLFDLRDHAAAHLVDRVNRFPSCRRRCVIVVVIVQPVKAGQHRVGFPKAAQRAGLEPLGQLRLEKGTQLFAAHQILRRGQIELGQQVIIAALGQCGFFSLCHLRCVNAHFGLCLSRDGGAAFLPKTAHARRFRFSAGEA